MPRRLSANECQLLVIDVQEKLVPRIHESAQVVAQCVRMMKIAGELGLPLTLSEQYREGLGATVAPVAEAAAGAAQVEKMTFSACGDAAALGTLVAHGRPYVLIAGIEAHVCVQLTALDLLNEKMQPVVLADAVGSQRPMDRETALARLRQEGVLITTVEAAAFEMMERADTALFKRVLKLLK